MSAEDREKILDEARSYVTKDRNASYGEPEDNFSDIAEIWNAQGVRVNGKPVSSTDVALMMIGMKLARLKHNVIHRDSWVDTIGYAACGWDTVASEDDSIVKEGPLKGWHKLGYTEDGAEFKIGPVTTRNTFNFVDLEPTDGWISHNRCGESDCIDDGKKGAVRHDGHSYNAGAGWCDGYSSIFSNNPLNTALRRDIDTVKRVADKHAAKVCTLPGHAGCTKDGEVISHHPAIY